jgi:EAL domain-containing protein (putative c-di-GMP-specific phosphodiesterase class I)
MDDFGTGYSSLSYLQRFPFDKIKIDKSFIQGMEEKSDCLAIVRAVISLGRSLGMLVNAEGVETEAQCASLIREGCGELQGFLFSRPQPAVAVTSMLLQHITCGQSTAPKTGTTVPSPRTWLPLPAEPLPAETHG